jgi:hypothetical protein
MKLTGEIPGLLRRCSPVRLVDDTDRSLVVDRVEAPRAWVGHWERLTSLVLDLSDPTGRFHCRLWLAERGHNVGSEDRAEVLAWSVLSVWRGGKPLRGVAQKWSFSAKKSWWRRKASRAGFWTASVWHTKWQSMGGMGDKTGEAGKAAADADLLRLGWALTNDDGTLTLPPLPGAL